MANFLRKMTFSLQPHNTRWLSAPQRRLAQVRLAEDAGEADEDAVNESYVFSTERSLPIADTEDNVL